MNSAWAAEATTTGTVHLASIQIDWTINVGHIGAVLVCLFAVWRTFSKLQIKVDQIEKDMAEFKQGIKDFNNDFKMLGAQVVHALVAIARLEGRVMDDNPPDQSHGSRMADAEPRLPLRGRHRDK